MIDPLVIRVLMIAMAFLLLGAASHKLANWRKFSAVVADFNLLPGFLEPVVAAAIPIAEILLGLAWLAGFEPGLVAPLTASMFLVYTLAVGINLRRGRVHISCGCGLAGSPGEHQPLSRMLVYRNILLVLLALLPLVSQASRTLGLFDGFAMFAALLAATLLYFTGAQLLQNQSAIRSWRNPRV